MNFQRKEVTILNMNITPLGNMYHAKKTHKKLWVFLCPFLTKNAARCECCFAHAKQYRPCDQIRSSVLHMRNKLWNANGEDRAVEKYFS